MISQKISNQKSFLKEIKLQQEKQDLLTLLINAKLVRSTTWMIIF